MSQQPPGDGPPQSLEYAAPLRGAGVYLRQVAAQQRAINLCILAEIVILVGRVFSIQSGAWKMAMAISIVYLAVAIVGAVFLFTLAISLYNTGVGVVLGILTLVPILGLIILLIVNHKATTVLRGHGIKVGLLGANPSTIPSDGGG